VSLSKDIFDIWVGTQQPPPRRRRSRRSLNAEEAIVIHNHIWAGLSAVGLSQMVTLPRSNCQSYRRSPQGDLEPAETSSTIYTDPTTTIGSRRVSTRREDLSRVPAGMRLFGRGPVARPCQGPDWDSMQSKGLRAARASPNMPSNRSGRPRGITTGFWRVVGPVPNVLHRRELPWMIPPAGLRGQA